MTEVAREEGRGTGRGRGGERGRGRGRGRGRERGRELWVFWAFFGIIDRCMGGCAMNKDGFLILLELCTVYFAFQYTSIFDPATGFQVRYLLVETGG